MEVPTNAPDITQIVVEWWKKLFGSKEDEYVYIELGEIIPNGAELLDDLTGKWKPYYDGVSLTNGRLSYNYVFKKGTLRIKRSLLPKEEK